MESGNGEGLWLGASGDKDRLGEEDGLGDGDDKEFRDGLGEIGFEGEGDVAFASGDDERLGDGDGLALKSGDGEGLLLDVESDDGDGL